MLFNHNFDWHLGVVESASMERDLVGRATVRFGKGEKAEQKYQDVLDRILTKVSVTYIIHEVILEKDNLVIKRLWNLDTNTYAEGALDSKTKELLGLVASMVLRCDDCIKYHVGKAHEMGISTEQLYEVFAVANIVGGTIVIPHTRRAAEYWEELQGNIQ